MGGRVPRRTGTVSMTSNPTPVQTFASARIDYLETDLHWRRGIKAGQKITPIRGTLYQCVDINQDWDICVKRMMHHTDEAHTAKAVSFMEAFPCSAESIDSVSVLTPKETKEYQLRIEQSLAKRNESETMLYASKTVKQKFMDDKVKHIIRHQINITEETDSSGVKQVAFYKGDELKAHSTKAFEVKFDTVQIDKDIAQQVVEHFSEKALNCENAVMTIHDCQNNLRTALELTKDAFASRRVINGKPNYQIAFGQDGTLEVVEDALMVVRDYRHDAEKLFSEIADRLGMTEENERAVQTYIEVLNMIEENNIIPPKRQLRFS